MYSVISIYQYDHQSSICSANLMNSHINYAIAIDMNYIDWHIQTMSLPDFNRVRDYKSDRNFTKSRIETYLDPTLWNAVSEFLSEEKPLLMMILTPTWMHKTIINGL